MRCVSGVVRAYWKGIDLLRAVKKAKVSRTVWEVRSQRVKAPYTKFVLCVGTHLEYSGTREILLEAGGTTLQGYILGSYR